MQHSGLHFDVTCQFQLVARKAKKKNSIESVKEGGNVVAGGHTHNARTHTLTQAHDHEPDSAENVFLFLHPFFFDVRRERASIVQFLPIAKPFDGFDLQLGKAKQ